MIPAEKWHQEILEAAWWSAEKPLQSWIFRLTSLQRGKSLWLLPVQRETAHDLTKCDTTLTHCQLALSSHPLLFMALAFSCIAWSVLPWKAQMWYWQEKHTCTCKSQWPQRTAMDRLTFLQRACIRDYLMICGWYVLNMGLFNHAQTPLLSCLNFMSNSVFLRALF